MNNNDDMHRFIAALMPYGIVFALICSLLLLGLAALLIWRPMVLLEILRYAIATICVGAAVWIIGSLLIGISKKSKRKES